MRFEESVLVDRPIEDVWVCMANLFDAPRLWGPSVLGMRQTSPGPLGLGTTMRGRMSIFGFEVRMDAVIKEWDPPHRLVMSMNGGPMRSPNTRYALESVGNRTRLTRSTDIALHGPLGFLLLLLQPMFKRGMRNASRSLKEFIESRPRSV